MTRPSERGDGLDDDDDDHHHDVQHEEKQHIKTLMLAKKLVLFVFLNWSMNSKCLLQEQVKNITCTIYL